MDTKICTDINFIVKLCTAGFTFITVVYYTFTHWHI